MPETCRSLGWRCDHFQTVDPLLNTRLPRKVVVVSLMSNNSDTSKIHLVVVFLDMAGLLGVMVKHSNSPFVFCNASFE